MSPRRIKNPHAVALGRMKSPAKAASSARNGHLGGRPRIYRFHRGQLELRTGDTWTPVQPPFNLAARRAVKRLQHTS